MAVANGIQTGTSGSSSSTARLNEMLDADMDMLLTDDGITQEELITILKKISDDQAVAKECQHFADVLQKEREFQEKFAQAALQAEDQEALEDHEITDFARELVKTTKHAPLRMTEAERQVWKILEAALQVSEYTDKIDVLAIRGNKTDTIVEEILELCNGIAGMIVANSYDRAVKQFRLLENDDEMANGNTRVNGRGIGARKQRQHNHGHDQNEKLFQRVFELGRRAKILNPSQMRSTYGKMMWVLMDAKQTGNWLGFDPVRGGVRTVYELLMEKDRKDAEAFLKEPLLKHAIVEISETDAKGNPLPRADLDAAKKKKQDAVEKIKAKYGRQPAPANQGSSVADLLKTITEEAEEEEQEKQKTGGNKVERKKMTIAEVECILKSLQDHNTFVDQHAGPVQKMIDLQEKFFKPQQPRHESDDLSIRSGRGGSCLSHSHETQYKFVNQSLTLWRNIMRNMVQLWHNADQDMLDNRYRLADTGQGLNRMQQSPAVRNAMGEILRMTQQDVGRKGQSWVGLSVVHLGDRDVPNALVFIDKYVQVPRILGPLVKVIEKLPILYQQGVGDEEEDKQKVREFIDKFGGVESAQKLILRDFFRHGFDGSGDDGGSCVDGRLTSCWNWCSQIEKKVYFPLFLLCGHHGFDG
ncbi:unnamed protein product [Amoebophrya sp. A120]|nr:unnamed protein product [Amoebophrya sp. A120]|eukprot:GSA120T00001235001.1